MTSYRFPSVADSEPIIETPKAMKIYENEDLITNIQGLYQEKDYSDVTYDYEFVNQRVPGGKESFEREKTINEGKSYAELAREKARRDVQEKRQTYLVKDINKPSKPNFKKDFQSSLPKKKQLPVSNLSCLADKLRQEDYILAELPIVYQEPVNASRKSSKKNNYDFLKRSQIYNKKENQSHKEALFAQELNLSRFEDVK